MTKKLEINFTKKPEIVFQFDQFLNVEQAVDKFLNKKENLKKLIAPLIPTNLEETIQKLIPEVSDGYTPQKGVDYDDGKDGETPSDEKIISLIKPQIPKVIPGKDGTTPKKGIDYFTKKELDEIKKELKTTILSEMPEHATKEEVNIKITEVLDKIRKLPTGGGGAQFLRQLMDVNVGNPTAQQYGLTYNPSRGEFALTTITGGGAVDSVNGQTGVVVLDAGDISGFATVATTGSYNDLIDKPTIPTGTIDGTLTTNELVYSVDANTVGSLAVATYPSLAELAHVKGVTSAIQTQINGKEPTKGADDNYVTDAQLVVIGNTSGTNTGDNATNSQYSGLAASKQDVLVSGTNIKTVNSTTLLGSGNIDTTQTTITGNAGTATTLQTTRTIGTLTGDVTSAGSSFDGSANNTNATTVVKINGTSLAGLATGILKNTTTTGVPSIAVNSDLPVMTATVGGAVPTPPNNTTTFLRGDGTFATPSASASDTTLDANTSTKTTMYVNYSANFGDTDGVTVTDATLTKQMGRTRIVASASTGGVSTILPWRVGTSLNPLFSNIKRVVISGTISVPDGSGIRGGVGFAAAISTMAGTNGSSVASVRLLCENNSGIYAVTANGSSNTNTLLDSTNDGSSYVHHYCIDFDKENSSVKYYLNGSLAATHTTNIPNTAATALLCAGVEGTTYNLDVSPILIAYKVG